MRGGNVTDNAKTMCARRWGVRAAVLAAVLSSWSPATAQTAAARCSPGQLVRVPELPEGSGVAASRRTPGRVWAHNDSGDGGLIALNDRGAVTGRVQLPGIKVENWEALAVGPCPGGSCLFIGDIGDNQARRRQVTVYRVAEPEGVGNLAAPEAFHATYPDGPQDAEALLVTPKGDVLIVTKGETGAVALYRLPRDVKPGGTTTLERVGKPRGEGKASPDDRITDGAISPSGERIVLRTQRALLFYSTTDLLAGTWREQGRLDLASLGEPQGEGVTFADNSTLYLVGEGGGKSQAGTFARVTCTF
jgi:hypothetical protein